MSRKILNNIKKKILCNKLYTNFAINYINSFSLNYSGILTLICILGSAVVTAVNNFSITAFLFLSKAVCIAANFASVSAFN